MHSEQRDGMYDSSYFNHAAFTAVQTEYTNEIREKCRILATMIHVQ
jgi:hypothetical protein